MNNLFPYKLLIEITHNAERMWLSWDHPASTIRSTLLDKLIASLMTCCYHGLAARAVVHNNKSEIRNNNYFHILTQNHKTTPTYGHLNTRPTMWWKRLLDPILSKLLIPKLHFSILIRNKKRNIINADIHKTNYLWEKSI